MCGRFTLTTPAQQLQSLFDQLEVNAPLTARYNIAPTQEVLGVRHRAGTHLKEAVALRWGLIPSWTENPQSLTLVNARCETLAEKPSFREAFRKRRCLIPADGFFEWKLEAGRKRPYRITRRDGKPFLFAGLWESWKDDAGRPVESCAIVTTTANRLLQPLHERMPVLVPSEWVESWLDPQQPIGEYQQLFRPAPEELLELHEVSGLVNNARADTPECIEPPRLPTVQQRTLWEE